MPLHKLKSSISITNRCSNYTCFTYYYNWAGNNRSLRWKQFGSWNRANVQCHGEVKMIIPRFLLSFISLALLVVNAVGVTEVSFNNSSNITTLSGGFSNPFVICTPQIVTIPDILGVFYPNQSLTGSQYQINASEG